MVLVIKPGDKAVCPHGSPIAGSSLLGPWNGGVSTCECCHSIFGYIDASNYGPNGSNGRSWTPKWRCGRCGGRYEEWSNN